MVSGTKKTEHSEAAEEVEQTAQEVEETDAEPQSELDTLRALVHEHEDLLKRVQADFENSLKRTARDIERAEQAAEARIVIQLLPLVDTIEAGLRAEQEGSEAHRTLLMVKDALDRTLKNLDVRPISSTSFDPDLHEALMTRPGPEGAVLDVIQPGYRRGERILRHAKVIIGNGHEPRSQKAEPDRTQ
ncbi:MAG: nucleotide exchange factor GrpE [Candidatus Woesearchaeota archaeon]